jgi:hypothetical protein
MADLRSQLQAALGDAYTLERELGGGGMSRVFLATERALGPLKDEPRFREILRRANVEAAFEP